MISSKAALGILLPHSKTSWESRNVGGPRVSDQSIDDIVEDSWPALISFNKDINQVERTERFTMHPRIDRNPTE